MGAMIFSKQPLDDSVLIMLPQVKILHFHHCSFEDFLLSTFFVQELPEISTVQDRSHNERQLSVLCLKTLVSSKLHFNMCNLESLIIENINIQSTVKSIIPPLILYSSLCWVNDLIQAPSDEKMTEAVKFVMYEKLLFWLEVMSLTGNVYEAYPILRRASTWQVCFQIISLKYI